MVPLLPPFGTEYYQSGKNFRRKKKSQQYFFQQKIKLGLAFKFSGFLPQKWQKRNDPAWCGCGIYRHCTLIYRCVCVCVFS